MADGRLIFDTSINTSGFEKGLAQLESKTSGTTSSVAKGILGAEVLKKGVQELIEFGKESIEVASNLEEVQNVIDVTFGENADSIRLWAKSADKQYGIAEVAALKYAGQFGTLFKTAGLADDQVLQYTKDLVGLGGDFASFWDNDIEVSLTKILSALKGETEAINDYGVDVRIAALSAFTGKKMDGASQLEQMEAIYGKLMADTTAVQGDFVRTNESFANQVRILQTNIQQLQAEIGQNFLPVLTSVVSAINDIFDPKSKLTIDDDLKTVSEGFKSFNDEAQLAAEYFKNTEDAISGSAALAEKYLQTIESLEGKDIKTDEDILAIQNAVAALNNLYPELQLYFDPATGKINENTQEIRDNIAAMQTLAVQNLFSEQQQANAQRYAQAMSNLADAQTALDEAMVPLDNLETQISGINGILSQLEGNNFTQLDPLYGQFADKIKGFDQYFTKNLDGSWTAKNGMPVDIGQITNSAQNALAALNIERELVLKGISDAQAAVDGYNQTMMEIDSDQAALVEKQEKTKQLMENAGKDAADAETQGISDNSAQVETAVDIMNQKAAQIDASIYFNAGRKAAHQYAMGIRSVSVPALGGTSSGTQTDGSHATGLSYVPYDNYIANLHVGEAVLNASEARAWRNSEQAAAASNDLPSAAYANHSGKTVINIDGQKVAEIQGYNNSRQIAMQNNRHSKGVGSK